eukprot:scaffold172822_cov60-Attheya_sp.AAC.2
MTLHTTEGTEPELLLGAGNGRQAPITIKSGALYHGLQTRGERGWEGARVRRNSRLAYRPNKNATIAYTGRNVPREASTSEKCDDMRNLCFQEFSN